MLLNSFISLSMVKESPQFIPASDSNFFILSINELVFKDFDKGISLISDRILSIIDYQFLTHKMLLGTNIISIEIAALLVPILLIFGFINSIALFSKKVRDQTGFVKLNPLIISVFFLSIYLLITPDNPFGLAVWPQRILLLLLPLSCVLIVITITNFIGIKFKPFKKSVIPIPKYFIILSFLIFPAHQFFKLADIGKKFQVERYTLESKILEKEISNTFLKLNYQIEPRWMESVMFSLLRSQKFKSKNIVYLSPWHFHPQHNITSIAIEKKEFNSKILTLNVKRTCKNQKCSWLVDD
jgi:hypothetical protein